MTRLFEASASAVVMGVLLLSPSSPWKVKEERSAGAHTIYHKLL